MPDEKTVLEFRVSALEGVVSEIKLAVKSIDQSLQTLARLEERHAETRDGLERAFGEIKDHEDRIRSVESDMPTMRLIRNWIVSGVLGTLGLVGVAVAKLVFGA